MKFLRWLRCYLKGHCPCTNRVRLVSLNWQVKRVCCFCKQVIP